MAKRRITPNKRETDPYVLIAVDVLENAVHRIVRDWDDSLSLADQSRPVREALAFLAGGVDGPIPAYLHELARLEVLLETPPERIVAGILANCEQELAVGAK